MPTPFRCFNCLEKHTGEHQSLCTWCRGKLIAIGVACKIRPYNVRKAWWIK